ncbi:class II aldolase/adducin family protein [Micromonospora sp. MA102]|uniref:class II aldolase/adducin family protein n=1 Tax=Micromonospora sp. MA102 TaxID=2952755 RepID=UPI0021C66BFC|nr:class II aldolase/adducin family protein [Micromonospora sp. MA102]
MVHVADPVDLVVRAHRALAVAGQADMVWGHVSVRDPEGRGVWMKSAGWGLEEISHDQVVLVAWDGEVLAGSGPRHLEYPIHTEVMRARPEVTCVVHTHAEAVNAFSALDVPVRPISHAGVLFSEPDVPRFTRTGGLIRTAELGAALAASMGPAPACLLPKHGLATAGVDAAHAVMYAVLLDQACRTQLQAMAAGDLRVWSDPDEAEAKRTEVWPPSQIEAGWRYLERRPL